MNNQKQEMKQAGQISRQIGEVAQAKRSDGVMSLADEAISKLSSLTENLNELEKIISPVMELTEVADEIDKYPESPIMDRPDSKLRLINRELDEKINDVKRLVSRINI